LVAFFALFACRRGPEPEVPDMLGDAEAEKLSHEVKLQKLSQFHDALIDAEGLHDDQKSEPCGAAWGLLQDLIAGDYEAQQQSAEFYRVCGCCFDPDRAADEKTADAR
jgi:hypothetical protein